MVKKIFFFLLLLFVCPGIIQAQQYTVTGGTSSNAFPFSSTTNRVQWLYLPTDFSSPPLAGMITKIYFKTSAAISSTTLSNFTIKLGLSNLTATSAGSWITPVTTVFSSPSYTISGISAGGWIGVTLQTPFFYDGVSSIIFDASNSAYTTGFTVPQNSSNGSRRIWGTQAGATPTSAGAGLVDFGFDWLPAGANNASAAAITEPNNFCAGTYPVKLKIANNGNNQIQPVKVYWTLDGVAQPVINYTSLLDTFGSVAGNTALVTLGNVSFGSTGTHTIKAWTSMPNNVADTINMDDTTTRTMGAALNGIYTVGGAAADYPTVAAAVNALNNYGVCGPVTMKINSGTYTEQVALNAVSGASSTNTITFTSATGNATDVTIKYTGTSAANYVFKLSGCSYVTVRNITLAPVSTTYGYALTMDGAASNNTIRNCVFTIPSATGSSMAGIYASGISGRKNSFIANNITNGYYGIYYFGSSSLALSDSCVVDSNTITNPYYYGMYLYYTSDLKVRNNTITRTTTGGTSYSLYTGYADNALEIRNNVITVSGAATAYGIYYYYSDGDLRGAVIANNKVTISGATTCYGLYPYYSNYAGAYTSTIKNNIISVQSTSSSYGLYNYYAGNINFLNNTFYSSSTGSTNYGGYFYNTSTTYGNINAYNNIFCNTGTTGYPLAAYTVLNNLKIDYNNVYGAGTNLFYCTSPATSYTTLDAWRAATGYDRFSISYRPGFMSATNLVPNPADTASWSLNGHGVQFAGNNVDFNGNVRQTNPASGVPDIGPYEFTPTVLPPVAIASPATPAPGTTQVFTFGQDTVGVISWASSSSVPSSIKIRQYAGVLPPSLPVGSYMYFYDSLEVPSGTYNYQSNIYYKPSWFGNVTLENALHLSERVNGQPWSNFLGTNSVDVNRHFVTASGITKMGLQTGRMENCSGQPVAVTFTTTPFTSPRCVGDTTWLAANDPNNVASMAYQWQKAPTANGPWTSIPGATSLTYITPSLTDTTFYRIADTCQLSGLYAVSNVFMLPIFNPSISGVNVSPRCGPGIANLHVNATPGSKIKWYSTPTSMTPIDTGINYTTPFLYNNTTYYVAAASNNMVTQAVGSLVPVNTSNGNSGFSDLGIMFTTYAPIVIQSVDVYPQGNTGTGTVTIALKNSAGAILQQTTATVNVTAIPGVVNTVPLNFNVPVGTNYRLVIIAASGMTYINRDYTAGTFTFPYTIPGIISLTSSYSGGATSSYYYYLYNWKVTGGGCESARLPVPVNITPAPAVVFTPDTPKVCLGETLHLSASSTNSGYSYTWNPMAVNNSSINIAPNATTQYYLTAIDSSGGLYDGCAVYDTVTVLVSPVPFAIVTSNNPLTFCSGDSVTLSAYTSPNYSYQWYQNGTAISNATDTTLTVYTPGIYTVKVTESGVCAITSSSQPVGVFPTPNPIIFDHNGILQTTTFAAYQWLKDSVIIAGATSATYTPSSEGEYFVVVTDANGCTSKSKGYNVWPTAIPDVNTKVAIKVYPNPVADVVNIDAPVPVRAILSTVDGRELFTGEKVQQINISSFSSGLYILRLYGKDGQLLKQSKLTKL